MKEFFAGLGILIGICVLVVLVTVGGNALGFWQYSFYAPKIAHVQSQVFHQSQQYSDAQTNNLANYKNEYYEPDATAASRANIQNIVRDQYANYPEDQLTPDLRDFLDKMKGE